MQGGDMAEAWATLLCRVLLAAAGGLPLSYGIELLEGLQGQSLSFPALHPMSEDIVRVIWRFQGTHIAEAKPRQKKFTTDYLPRFRGRLFIHPASLSLEIRLLEPGDSGRYEVLMDTFSDPTNPKTFSYLLSVNGDSPMTTTEPDGTEGHSRSMAGPRGVTEPYAANTVTWGAGGGQPPGNGGESGGCGAQERYCVVKGYLVAAVFGPLLMLVVAIHIVTRDKATELGVSVGPRVGSERPGITMPQGPAPWQR